MPLCFRGLLARCAPRETALIRGLLVRTCRSGVVTLVLARVKNSTLEPGLEMSMMLLPASRGQVELFGEQPTREPTPFRFSRTLSLALVPHPPHRSRSSTLVPFLLRSSLSPFLSLSRSPRPVHSYTAVARKLGNVKFEEGPSGPYISSRQLR